MADKTKDWQLYENGVSYNNRLSPNYYETVNANWDFFSGNQWRNLPDSDMPKPVFNIIKRVITFFVASLTTSKAKIHFEPMMYSHETPDTGRVSDAIAAAIANKQIDALFEKFKMEFRIKDALFDSAITGDAAAHFYFDVSKKPYGSRYSEIKGEICMELVDGTNIFFGNANSDKTENQPYIIVSGRDMVKNLKEEAERYKNNPDAIREDSSYTNEAGYNGKIEVEGDESGKAEYIIIYRKVKKTRKGVDPATGMENEEEYTTITASKSVESAYIYQDIDTGLSNYPVAWLNWEKQKNTYHGRALCTGMLPNQIFINRMFAMVMYHLMMTAFPKAVYNADVIDLWTNAVGEAIPVTGVDLNTNLQNIAGYLQPGNMSNQIMEAIDLAMQYTKEMLGASDAALGQIDPKNTSAIIAVQKSSAIPLENPKSNLYEWIEDIGKILFDMMGTYYGPRPVMLDDGTVQDFDFATLKDAWLDIRADVGESSYWSEIASLQTLDNLLANGHITIDEYLKRIPDEQVPQKEELIQEIQARMAQALQQQMEQAQMGAPDPNQAEAEQEAAMQSSAQDFQQKAALKQMEIDGKMELAKLNKKAK
ncbi:hypothetical protein [Paenibacillus silvisoli]|uniref:hypothetical protein n=1 Tax=Paenibacillus silvisoli TaxID=3110539 RepID=UPI0028046EFC|nr:hypothetical protein [Paenibacillus silvisoli]